MGNSELVNVELKRTQKVSVIQKSKRAEGIFAQTPIIGVATTCLGCSQVRKCPGVALLPPGAWVV